MDLNVTLTFGAPPDQVAVMLTDPEFQRELCEKTARSGSASVRSVGDRTEVHTRRAVSTVKFPDFVRSFVGETLTVDQRTLWGPPDAAGRREGSVVVLIEGKPLHLVAQAELAPTDDGTVVRYDGTLTADVLFIGGRIESAAAPVVRSALDSEETLGRQWLAERSL